MSLRIISYYTYHPKGLLLLPILSIVPAQVMQDSNQVLLIEQYFQLLKTEFPAEYLSNKSSFSLFIFTRKTIEQNPVYINIWC